MLSSVGWCRFWMPSLFFNTSMVRHQLPCEVFSFVSQHGFHALLERVFRSKVGPIELNFHGLFAQFIPLLNQLRWLPIEQLEELPLEFIRHLIVEIINVAMPQPFFVKERPSLIHLPFCFQGFSLDRIVRHQNTCPRKACCRSWDTPACPREGHRPHRKCIAAWNSIPGWPNCN